jgi:hypothetical protein
MTSKKYKLILGLITLMTTTATFAQMGSSYSVFDSSVVPAKKLPQQNEFWNNTYNFPAKPRNMVEVGVSLGNILVAGDVDSKIPALGFEAHVRKALGYVFSLRLQYLNGSPKGLNWRDAENYGKNPAWVSTASGSTLTAAQSYKPGIDAVFYNYKTHMQDLGLQGIFTLNNVRFHKQKTGVTFYAGGGVGASWYNVKVNSLDANGNNYSALFNGIASGSNGAITYSNRKKILKALKAGMDNTYETAGESEGSRRPKLGKNTLRPSATVLAGVAFKLSNRVNLALEDRHTFVKSDLLDGQRWQEQPFGAAVLTPDYDSYNYLSLGINFNLGGKAVEPLWWLNPLDYAYSELNNPKHMKLPKPILDDTDGDGVTDQLDREPNTPAGCPVDSHGVTRDTDGDGVPDCKDKQLITPTECQPVDADGVGKCPDPACCSVIDSLRALNACATDYPSLSVKGASLSADTKALLASVATKLKDKPNCTITLTAYPGASKAQQSLADKKLDAVKNYLVEKLGISADRVSVDKVIDGGDSNTIDIKSN